MQLFAVHVHLRHEMSVSVVCCVTGVFFVKEELDYSSISSWKQMIVFWTSRLYCLHGCEIIPPIHMKQLPVSQSSDVSSKYLTDVEEY